MNRILEQFSQIWLVDFEFQCPSGENPRPICLVAHEFKTNVTHRIWEDELRLLKEPPYATGKDALFIAYFSTAELGCHLALDWPLPKCVLDLYVEFRNLTNGRMLSCGAGLIGAMAYFGLDCIVAAEKNEMRDIAIRGGPFSDEERVELLNYCESDVTSLRHLFQKMAGKIDLPRALLRGRYMRSVARMENRGIPIDAATFNALKGRWSEIQFSLIETVDRDFNVFEGKTFKRQQFEKYLNRKDIAWPTHPSGSLNLDDDTFKDMARVYPALNPLRELRSSLSKLRLTELAVGVDGRNRCLLSPFKSKTSRNQPSNSKFIFGPSVWMRSLVKPRDGWGIAYVDWSQQEFGIGAALAKDDCMKVAYCSGDPYLAFAIQAGVVPDYATKEAHRDVREQFKQCVLATQYGMGPESLAQRIRQPVPFAKGLLELHRKTYRKFWEWSDSAVDYALLFGEIHTMFGWSLAIEATATQPINARSIRNFPIQAGGAEMLRLACIVATEAGVRVCAPIHDALLIEAPLDELDAAIAQTQAAMAEASRIVLDGFELKSEAEIFRYPNRYADDRGVEMWGYVSQLIAVS